MLKAPIAENEIERINTLCSYEVLDTLQEKHFDEITKTASLICNCKISLISLIDESRQWFKSRHGLDIEETPRDISFCGHAIMQDEVFIVEDAELDDRFCDNPLFLNEPYVRFYAGAPLIAPNGQRIGTLCVIDSESKRLSEKQILLLKTLSKQVISYLEIKKKSTELRSAYEQSDRMTRMVNETNSVAKVGGFELVLDTKILYFTDEALNIFNLSDHRDNIAFELEDLYGSFLRDDRALIIDSFNACIQEEKSFDLEPIQKLNA